VRAFDLLLFQGTGIISEMITKLENYDLHALTSHDKALYEKARLHADDMVGGSSSSTAQRSTPSVSQALRMKCGLIAASQSRKSVF
jgi:hypothetical protein